MERLAFSILALCLFPTGCRNLDGDVDTEGPWWIHDQEWGRDLMNWNPGERFAAHRRLYVGHADGRGFVTINPWTGDCSDTMYDPPSVEGRFRHFDAEGDNTSWYLELRERDWILRENHGNGYGPVQDEPDAKLYWTRDYVMVWRAGGKLIAYPKRLVSSKFWTLSPDDRVLAVDYLRNTIWLTRPGGFTCYTPEGTFYEGPEVSAPEAMAIGESTYAFLRAGSITVGKIGHRHLEAETPIHVPGWIVGIRFVARDENVLLAIGKTDLWAIDALNRKVERLPSREDVDYCDMQLRKSVRVSGREIVVTDWSGGPEQRFSLSPSRRNWK